MKKCLWPNTGLGLKIRSVSHTGPGEITADSTASGGAHSFKQIIRNETQRLSAGKNGKGEEESEKGKGW